MDFDFVLDEDYLAYFILQRKMYEESEKITEFKKKKYLDNDLGYKKILEEELLDLSVYFKDEKIKNLINEFIATKKFNEIYKSYSNESKEIVAIKILKNIINDNSLELDKIKDELWNKYLDSYKYLLNIDSSQVTIFLLDKDIKKTIEDFKKTLEFKKLYEETSSYLHTIKKSWEENKATINNYLKRVLKIDFDIKPTVYISHPSTLEGHTLYSHKEIAWGHYLGLKDPNYNLTYLIHEGLHCLFPYDKTDTKEDCDIKHTVIELIADYELYSLLSGKSTLKEGHPYLDKYRKIIYPYWLKYIGLNDLEILKRLEKNAINYNKLNNTNDIDVTNMNIIEFMNFCLKICKIDKEKTIGKAR